MKNQYSGGKALVGNWYEDRLETKNPPQPPIARDKDPELKVTRIKRVPGNDTADRVMPKHTTPEYNTENQAALRRHKQLKPLPSRKMMQFCNFEHMNEKRPLPNAPEYGFGAHFPLKKPQTVSAMSSTMHSSYGGKYAERSRSIKVPSDRLVQKNTTSRTSDLNSTYSSSFMSSSSPKRVVRS